MSVVIEPYIPSTITVHLGRPEVAASNVTVSFPEYIKNVASSEIYPTWPQASLIANIYAQISFALNKIYTEYYRSRGYPFDITNSTSIDQAFTPGRNIFENISQLVDEIFDTYIRRQGYLEPLFAQFCNGTTVTCEGLSQWGTVPLAEQGYTPYGILQYYYGENIDLVRNAPVESIRQSYPGTPLSLGSRGPDVQVVQVELNRISQNYPAIPKIYPVDGIFGPDTQRSVQAFQRIFGLSPDGVVGKATWYKLVYLYVGVKRLNEIAAEGQSIYGLTLVYPEDLREGDTGEKVRILQYFLFTLSDFYATIPTVGIDGIFGPQTRESVIAFQNAYSLPATGIVDVRTWDALYDAFQGVIRAMQGVNLDTDIVTQPYPGEELRRGSRGEAVRTLQEYLNALSLTFLSVPPVQVTGVYGLYTGYSVAAFQKLMGLPQTGVVDRATWDAIANSYRDVVSAMTARPRQYPGFPLSEGSQDMALMQQ